MIWKRNFVSFKTVLKQYFNPLGAWLKEFFLYNLWLMIWHHFITKCLHEFTQVHFLGRLFRNGRGTRGRWCWLLSGGVQSWWVWQEQTKLDRDYPGIHIHSYCCAHIHIVSWNILFQFQAQVKLQSFVIKDLNWQGVPQKTWIWELE